MTNYGNKNYGGRGGKDAFMTKGDKILCSIDKQWERADQFSNNERKKFTDAQRMGKRYAIRCRKHTQAPAPELLCSNCDERKPLEDFSNAQRKVDDDVRRCRLCINYTETVQFFEELEINTDQATPDDYMLLEGDGEDAVDHEHSDNESQAPRPDLDGASAQEDASVKAAWTSDRNASGEKIGGFGNLLLESRSKLVRPFPGVTGETSYGASSAPSETSSGADTETHRPDPRRSFFAYGPNGQVERRAASVVAASETASVATATTAATAATAAAAVPVTRSGWAKVATRKLGADAPDRTCKGKRDEDAEPKRYDFSSDGSEDEC